MRGPLPLPALIVQPMQRHNMFLTAPTTPYAQCPPLPRGPLVPHPAGSPSYSGTVPRYTHNPYTPHQPLLEIHSQPAYPAYYLSEPRYGLPPPPPPPLPLPVAPPPDQRDLELAYLRGHVAGLDRRSEHPAPPKVATQPAHQAARPEPSATAVGGHAAAPQAVPLHLAEPRDDRRSRAPTEAPRRPPEPVHRRPPPPRGDSGNP